MNPTIDADSLAAAKARDPGSFRSEYLAEFVAPGNAYLDFDRIELADGGPRPPAAGKGWIVGLDPAFDRDPFGVAVVGRDPENRRRLLLGHVEARKATGGFAGPLDAVAELAHQYRARLVTDQFASAAVLEHLSGAGLTVRETHNDRGVEDGDFLGASDPPLRRHPGRLRPPRPGRGATPASNEVHHRPGRDRQSTLGGSHGDIAQALAMAVYELRRAGPAAKRTAGGGGYGRTYRDGSPRPTRDPDPMKQR